ncbi:MAG: hypothetical protein ABW065_06465 [Solirubrobacterales bacterium]
MSWLSVRPSAATLESTAQIGATLLVAYALEISWLIRASRRRPLAERQDRMGAFTTMGAAAALGIAISLALAEQSLRHDWTWLDRFGFGWVVVSLFVLGLMIVMQPWMTHEWIDEDDRASG